jgi:hypothetical protein
VIGNKVKGKEMEKTKKDYKEPWRGTFLVIARKVGCTPKYASMVLRDKLGKYSDRDTELVKRIHEVAAEIDEMLKPQK